MTSWRSEGGVLVALWVTENTIKLVGKIMFAFEGELTLALNCQVSLVFDENKNGNGICHSAKDCVGKYINNVLFSKVKLQ